MQRFPNLFLLACTVSALGSAVFSVPAASAAARIDEVSVTGKRRAEPMNSTLGEVSKLSEELLQSVGHVHPQEIAVRVPGTWFSRGNGQEMLVAIRSPVYTGAGSCGEVLMSEEGVPIRPAGLCNVNQMLEINTEQASGLEIWRGAGTVFYGSSAVHGVINSLAPDPEKNRLAVEVGRDDFYRVKWAQGVTQGMHTVHVAMTGTTAGDVKEAAGVDQQKLSLQHRVESDRVRVSSLVSATNLNQETAGYVAGKGSYKGAGWRTNTNPEAYRNASSLRVSSRIENTDTDLTSWQVTPYYRRSDMGFLQHYLPEKPWEENSQESFGFLSSVGWQLQETARLWLGLDMERADMRVKEVQEDIFVSATNPRYQGTHYNFDVVSDQVAVFANAEWEFVPGWFAELGARSEWLRYDYTNYLPNGATRADGSLCGRGLCRFERPADREDEFSNLSGHWGLRAEWQNGWSSYLRLAHAYRAPQINERYRLLNGQSVDEFAEKTIDSLEWGARFANEDRVVQLSAYLMYKDDEVLKASNNATIGDAETRHRGVELELQQALAEQWQLTLAASWAQHDVLGASLLRGLDVEGNEMDTAPNWMGSAQVAYQSVAGWRSELEVVHMGSYYLDAENEASYPGHTLWNAIVSVPLAPGWESRLRLQNLTNRRYAERADYAFGDYRYFTGQPRGAYLEVSYQW